jgi:predicted transposase/invertase (TIGR01784 family)
MSDNFNSTLNQTKDKTLLSPKLDIVFQALFGASDSGPITSKFLEAILGRKISNIDLSKNPILKREYLKDKLGVLDIIAQLNNKELCNIELQIAKQDSIIERVLYYWSRTYANQLKAGRQYDKLEKTIAILIADFEVKGLENLAYHTSWKIIEEKSRKTILTEKLEIHIIELVKLDKETNKNDPLLDWLYFLQNPESERVVNKMKENRELKQAHDKLENLNNDEQMERLAHWIESAEYEYNSGMTTNYNEGLETGKKEGKKEASKAIAIELLKKGMDTDFIHQTTKLSIDEIKELQKTL